MDILHFAPTTLGLYPQQVVYLAYIPPNNGYITSFNVCYSNILPTSQHLEWRHFQSFSKQSLNFLINYYFDYILFLLCLVDKGVETASHADIVNINGF